MLPRGKVIAATTVLSLWVPANGWAQRMDPCFGLGAGYWLVSRTSVTTRDQKAQNLLLNRENRPLRLKTGLRFDGEGSLNLGHEDWWFVVQASVGLLRFGASGGDRLTQQFDLKAKERIGTVVGLQGQLGVRYFLIAGTLIRAYSQIGVSHMALLTTQGSTDAPCNAPGLCSSGTYGENLLAHRQVPGLHLQPGFEWVVAQNVGIRLYVDAARWLVVGAADNWAILIGLGFLFLS